MRGFVHYAIKAVNFSTRSHVFINAIRKSCPQICCLYRLTYTNGLLHIFNNLNKTKRYVNIYTLCTVPVLLSSVIYRDHKKAFRAAKQGNVKELRSLLQGGLDANTRHEYGWSLLHVASVSGQTETVKELLKHGAGIDQVDEFTNVYRMARSKQISSLKVNVTREDEFSDRFSARVSFRGCTALHYAVLLDHLEVIQLLLASGANPTAPNDNGHTALDYARDTQTRELLQQYISKYEETRRRREAEERRKFPLEMRIKEKIVGQEAAINIVSSAIRRKQNGWGDTDHPLVFLFLGSSGIGKTELAKQVAAYLHATPAHTQSRNSAPAAADDPGFIRIDMSEYQERHEVSKLIGSPPGYIGHDQGGQLTERLRRCPGALVLFDEVEKAHADVLTVLLQLFDEGRLTDGKGNTIECKDAIFVMTSNLASEKIAEHALQLRRETDEFVKQRHLQQDKPGQADGEKADEGIKISRSFKDYVVRPILKRHLLRDEFLGRINEIVYFLPFSETELKQLVTREMNLWRQRAQDKHSVSLYWNQAALEVLAKGYDVHYGARSIKHEVDRQVVNKLAACYENERLRRGDKVLVIASSTDPDSVELVLNPSAAFLEAHSRVNVDDYIHPS